jgi:DNA-directed RNA polymerase delta subunit
LDKLFVNVKADLTGVLGKKVNKNVFNSYLEISKKIQANAEGQIGLRNWVEINPRGIKDKAYLVLKKEQKPLHFSQVAILIGNSPFASQKKVHIATVHNELIKDSRFVLVGRGLYALKEWGYQPGVVKDVILGVLKEAKASLSREEIIKKVSAQRLVKENTISLNLRDQNYFVRGTDGRYKINPVQEA